mgnify:CR=1 FL=1
MQEKHIGDVLATNYFLSCILRKDVLDTSTNFTTYNIEYSLKDKQAYIDYQEKEAPRLQACLLYTSPSPRDRTRSRMPSSA